MGSHEYQDLSFEMCVVLKNHVGHTRRIAEVRHEAVHPTPSDPPFDTPVANIDLDRLRTL